MEAILLGFLIYFVGVLFALVIIATSNAKHKGLGYDFYEKGLISFSWFGIFVVVVIELLYVIIKPLNKLYKLSYKMFE